MSTDFKKETSTASIGQWSRAKSAYIWVIANFADMCALSLQELLHCSSICLLEHLVLPMSNRRSKPINHQSEQRAYNSGHHTLHTRLQKMQLSSIHTTTFCQNMKNFSTVLYVATILTTFLFVVLCLVCERLKLNNLQAIMKTLTGKGGRLYC